MQVNCKKMSKNALVIKNRITSCIKNEDIYNRKKLLPQYAKFSQLSRDNQIRFFISFQDTNATIYSSRTRAWTNQEFLLSDTRGTRIQTLFFLQDSRATGLHSACYSGRIYRRLHLLFYGDEFLHRKVYFSRLLASCGGFYLRSSWNYRNHLR